MNEDRALSWLEKHIKRLDAESEHRSISLAYAREKLRELKQCFEDYKEERGQ